MVPTPMSAGAVLRGGLPKSGEEVEGLEESKAIPKERSRPKDTPRAEPSLSNALGRAEVEGRKLSRRDERGREGHRPAKNLSILVTVLGATRDFRERVARRCNDFAQVLAGERFTAFWRGNGDGKRAFEQSLGALEGTCACELDILPRGATKPSLSWPQREEGGEPERNGLLLFSRMKERRGLSSSETMVADIQLVELAVEEIGDHYGRFRLHTPEAERAMARSLRRYGQLSPVVVCLRQGRHELIDGFKRLGAARHLGEWDRLVARVMEADDKAAKAAMYGLNRVGGKTSELEEAWIVYALVREDGVSQVEVAELLGRHKTWVCRRLALVEKLSEEAKAELRVGLLSPTAARHVSRLPQGNQSELLRLIRCEALTVHELDGVVNLLLRAASLDQQRYVFEFPREALSQAIGPPLPARDPRLSPVASQLWRRLSALLEMLARMEGFLTSQGRAGLTAKDRQILAPRFERLSRDATSVASLCRDLVAELTSA